VRCLSYAILWLSSNLLQFDCYLLVGTVRVCAVFNEKYNIGDEDGSAATIGVNSTATPNFSRFDSMSELWQDYLSRFSTFLKAHDVPESRKPQVFLTNQTATVYKLLANLAAQSSPPRRVNDLTMEEIEAFMTDQFNPNRFVVRERFKFWSEMNADPARQFKSWQHVSVRTLVRAIFRLLRTLSTKLFEHVLFVQSAMKRS